MAKKPEPPLPLTVRERIAAAKEHLNAAYLILELLAHDFETDWPSLGGIHEICDQLDGIDDLLAGVSPDAG